MTKGTVRSEWNLYLCLVLYVSVKPRQNSKVNLLPVSLCTRQHTSLSVSKKRWLKRIYRKCYQSYSCRWAVGQISHLIEFCAQWFCSAFNSIRHRIVYVAGGLSSGHSDGLHCQVSCLIGLWQSSKIRAVSLQLRTLSVRWTWRCSISVANLRRLGCHCALQRAGQQHDRVRLLDLGTRYMCHELLHKSSYITDTPCWGGSSSNSEIFLHKFVRIVASIRRIVQLIVETVG